MNHLLIRVLLSLALLGMFPLAAAAIPSQEPNGRVTDLQRRVSELERRVTRFEEAAAGAGVAAFVIGCFCALWAQNTGRSAWGWFFLGLIFHVVTLVVLLRKNADDIRRRSYQPGGVSGHGQE